MFEEVDSRARQDSDRSGDKGISERANVLIS